MRKSPKPRAYWPRTAHPPALQRQVRAAVRALLTEGRLRVHVGRVLALAEAAEAHRQLEGRRTVGKVVLRVP